MEKVVIVSACRTAIGNFNGALSPFSATDLGAMAIEEAIKRAGIEKNMVDEVIMGNVLPCGLGQNPGRQAMIKAGLPMEGGAITVNKVCGSGLKAVMLAEQAIKCGDADIIVAGGMESMTNAPYYLDKARKGYRMGPGRIDDHMVHDGLWDVVNDFHMGYTAELVKEKFNISTEEMNEFSVASNEKAISAHERGKFKEEIFPVKVPQRKGDPIIFDRDEGPRKTSVDIISKLKPAFKKDGTVNAGNASKISDGAAAVLVMTEKKAKELGLKPLASIVAQGAAGRVLEEVLVTPISSIPKVCKKAGINIADIELHEINEAFAVSSVAIVKELGIDFNKVNIHGGAVALGHPIGASGARVLVTLIYAMKDKGAKYGMASLCLGGGEAVSLLIENID
jgi:acetyl-CoA C-acetyltransferase